MSKEDLLKVEGVVTESLSGSIFNVQLKDGRFVKAKLSGRLRKFHIRIIVGDKVTLGMSPYDLTHGLIVSREKLGHHNPTPQS